MGKLSKHQMAVLRFVAERNVAGMAPVHADDIRRAGIVPSRSRLNTTVSLIDRGLLVVTERGTPAFNITNAGLAKVQNATRGT